MKQEIHDNNSNVNVQVDKNPTFKGGSEIPVAWWNPKYHILSYDALEQVECDEWNIPLYTSPQYRELSNDEILIYADAFGLPDMGGGYEFSEKQLIKFAKAILERAKHG